MQHELSEPTTSGPLANEDVRDVMPDEQGELTSTDGRHRLCVQTWSVDQPRAVLGLVHGLSDHGRRYGELAARLKQSRIQTTTIDLRGHGRSSGQRGHAASWRDLQDDLLTLVTLCRTRSPQAPLFLLGHSMGATLVLSTALDRPAELAAARVDSLIALSPLLLPAHNPPAWKIQLGKFLNSCWPTFSFLTQIDVRNLSHDEAQVEKFRNDPLRHGRVSARLALEMFSTGVRILASDEPLPCDCLLMAGSDDRVTSTAATDQWVHRRSDPRVQWRVWHGQYHELCHESIRGDVYETIERWISSRAGGQH
ncbi:MAG: alpha/beta hydrolase [Pirellulales bacterium]